MTRAAAVSTAEESILLLSARRHLTREQRAELERLLAGPVDWRFVLAMANRHRILPLLHASLKREGELDRIPPALLQVLLTAVRESVGQSLALTVELVRILREFEQSGVPAVPCKGPAAAVAAYGDISYRSFGDLDILVPPECFHLASRAVNALGYRPAFRLNAKQEKVYLKNECALPFRNEARGHIVELHWRFCERNASVRLPADTFAQRATRIALPGMTVASLAPEDLLVYLCVHGAKHRWERLEWIACVAELIRSQPQLDWPAAFERAAQYRVARLLNVGLQLARSLLDAELPSAVQSALEDDSAARKLADWVREELFAPPGSESHYQRRAARYLFMMRSRERWSDRARIFFYSAIRPPHPSANEWMKLPPRLEFLHRVFRPVRLLGEYSMVAWKHYLR